MNGADRPIDPSHLVAMSQPIDSNCGKWEQSCLEVLSVRDDSKSTYTEDLACVLLERLERASTLPLHLLVEYSAVVDFWIDEIQHCISVMDEYARRIEAIRQAQRDVLSDARFDWEKRRRIGNDVKPFRRGLPSSRLKALRQKLTSVAHRLFDKMAKEGLISYRDLERADAVLGR